MDERLDALQQLVDFGLLVDALDACGRIVRVRHRDDKSGTKNGWYVAYEYTTLSGRLVVVGAYGWWKEGDTGHKFAVERGGLSEAELREIAQRQRDLSARQAEARAQVAREAAERARKIWPKLPVDGSSAYLARKRVAAFGVRFSRGSVVVPLRTGVDDDSLVGLQWIDADGEKRLLTGTAKQGAFSLIGDRPAPGDVLAVVEGYATGATVHMATGWACAIAFDAGNLSEASRALVRLFPGVRVVVCADDDYATRGNPGATKGLAAARSVRGLMALPAFADGGERGSDWNDLHVSAGLAVVKSQLLAAVLANVEAGSNAGAQSNVVQVAFSGQDWRDALLKSDRGELRSVSYNVRVILEHDPAWAGVLGWCELSHAVRKRELPPLVHAARGDWEDGDDAELRFWLAGRYGIEPKGQDLADAVLGAARAKPYHPIREYLDGLQWDGTPRLATWLQDCLGCGYEESLPDEREDDCSRYLSLVGSMWMIQAVSRVRRPGLKADSVLILEGAQGRGKSTALRVLFGDDWFSDTPIEIGSKDAYESIRGLWGFEMAELDSLNKADASRAKAFFSSATDRFRLPYGHRSKKFHRQCVMAGTTNKFSHLRDETGNRRFWSVTVGVILLDRLREVRDQLWAEADYRYGAGEPWWPSSADLPLFESEQAARLDADVWEVVIGDWLRDKVMCAPPNARAQIMVTSAEIMGDALKIDLGSMKRPEQTRVGIVMHALGWRDCRPRVNGQRVKGYRPSVGYLESMTGNGAYSDEPAF